jgi:hypothetical protein
VSLARLLAIPLTLLPLTAPADAKSQSPSDPVVFAPGAVSIEGGNVFRGAFSPDGREFWFFRKVTEGEEDYRIFVSRLESGVWGPAERVLLGGEFSELYPSISPDGKRMVFTSYRPIPGDPSDHANANLWYVDRNADGSWGTPVFMEAASTLANYDNNPRFRADGAIDFGSTTPDWSTRTALVTRWDGTRYGPPEPDPLAANWGDWREDAEVARVSLSPDGALAVLDVRVEGRPSDLWFARRDGEGWTEPRPLAGGVNTPEAFENFAVFSPDGTEILFARGFALYWSVPVEAAISSP